MVDEIFSRRILSLISSSNLAMAETLVVAAIQEFASVDLKVASATPVGELRIVGWSGLCSDVVKADAFFRQKSGRGAALARLGLNNYSSQPRLDIDNEIYDAFEVLANGRVSTIGDCARIGVHRPLFVAGLEAIVAAHRALLPSIDPEHGNSRRQFDIDHRLSGLLLATRVHQIFDQYLNTQGLPIAVAVFLDTDPARQHALDYGHLGPSAPRLIATPTKPPASLDAIAEMLADQQMMEQEEDQKVFRTSIAELREIYRLIRMFPFYRHRGRHRIGEMLNNQLGLICRFHKLPGTAANWRLPKRDFERLLRTYAEARGTLSVDDALDVRHVNDLHGKWVAVAKEYSFKIPLVEGSLFELTLASALEIGGPIVHWRWEGAAAYSS